MIKVENLTKSFGELEVLKGINQEIKDGEVVVVIGPSGSGKSTFLRCLNLLEEPTSGKIFVDDEEITSKDIDINKVREEMGMVFQSFNLFNNLNIIDNITLAPTLVKKMGKEEAEKKAMELLERVGLPDKRDSYPKSLSGGQKQRIA
ncbi:amino acid ABC transporter ATP-binding protein, partial [Peptoniphilus grossensis]